MTQMDLSLRDLRQRELVPPDMLAACHGLVIGVGAIGRQVALQLAATGIPELTLIDHDTVDVVNLAPQGYAQEDLGQFKVSATAAWCLRLSPELLVHIHAERFRRSSARMLRCFDQNDRRLVIFCCVDSIETRKLTWESVQQWAAAFFDGRMSAEVVRVLCSEQPSTDQRYAQTLFTAQQAFVGSCTAKSTIYTASIAAGLMISQFTRWLRGISVDNDVVLNLLASEMTVN